MTHVQLRRQSGERVLPVYYSDNYVSLLSNETKILTVEADVKDLMGGDALVVVDGWNAEVSPTSAIGVSIQTNVDADPRQWPTTGLPFQSHGLR